MLSASLTFSEDLIVISLHYYKSYKTGKRAILITTTPNCNNEVLLLAAVIMWLQIFHFTLIHCISLPPASFRNLTQIVLCFIS